jgi:hypothetical protein|tara:strand:- start:17622 stop:18026 length:405 start_codon:yes stop_codon:yes gene_type:complete
MRDQKRRELALMEEAYQQVNENCMVPDVMVTQEPIQAVDVDTEQCGEHDQSEIDMAGRDLLKAQEYAAKLSAMVQQVPGLDGWVSAKITKASDYLSSVYHFLDYELREKPQEVVVDVEEVEGPVDIFNIGAEDT